MELNKLLPRIMGFLVIILTLALGPTIYTANTTIMEYDSAGTGLAPFIGMEVTAGFGAFIIIFGLLVSGGIFSIAGLKNKMVNAGIKDLLLVIGSVIIVIVMLSMFPTILEYTGEMITAATTAGDTIGEVGFGLIPVVIYVGVLALATAGQIRTYRKSTNASKASTKTLAYV
jgi:hypothetical protein